MPPAELRSELNRLGLNVEQFIVPVHGYTDTIEF